jgi:hypothetical protein
VSVLVTNCGGDLAHRYEFIKFKGANMNKYFIILHPSQIEHFQSFFPVSDLGVLKCSSIHRDNSFFLDVDVFVEPPEGKSYSLNISIPHSSVLYYFSAPDSFDDKTLGFHGSK